jgi:uncharacterized protein
MARVLLLILLIVAAVWLVRRALRRGALREHGGGATPNAKTADELVRCAQCGVLLPRAEARMSAGALYCSDEHARLGSGKR